MALVYTPGGTTANSYTSVEFATSYLMSERIGAEDWQDVGPERKEAALIQATRFLERKSYQGYKSDSAQALKFPRTGIFDEDGDQYATDAVPDDVQRACA